MQALPDFYHLNFNDNPLPIGTIFSDARIVGVILKHSQGTSYGDWAVTQAQRVRDAGHVVGGYHMLSGTDGSGAEQYAYFRTKFAAKPGDIVPAVDFESSGRGSASITVYRAKLIDFVKAAHAEGLEVMLYGHADVKAAFSDWRDSGADYWWAPGDQIHADVGPRGPDLWQYSPYTAPAGYPTDPVGNGQRADVSVVLTKLPLIGGGQEEDVYAQDYHTGQQRFANAQGPPGPDAPQGVKDGFADAKGVFDRAAAYADAHDAVGAANGVSKTRFDDHQHGEGRTTKPLAPTPAP